MEQHSNDRACCLLTALVLIWRIWWPWFYNKTVVDFSKFWWLSSCMVKSPYLFNVECIKCILPVLDWILMIILYQIISYIEIVEVPEFVCRYQGTLDSRGVTRSSPVFWTDHQCRAYTRENRSWKNQGEKPKEWGIASQQALGNN